MVAGDLGLMAHLFRRAGFGATRDEMEAYAARGYEEAVEDLVNPERCPALDEDIITRYVDGENHVIWTGTWIYRMVVTKRPLVEKMALFWHHVFATGVSKVEHSPSMVKHIQMFREQGLGDFRTLLVELSRDPAMIFWLDNNENKQRRTERELRARTARTVLDGCGQLLRGRHQERLPRVHRMDVHPADSDLPAGTLPVPSSCSDPRSTIMDEKTFLGEIPETSTARTS